MGLPKIPQQVEFKIWALGAGIAGYPQIWALGPATLTCAQNFPCNFNIFSISRKMFKQLSNLIWYQQ